MSMNRRSFLRAGTFSLAAGLAGAGPAMLSVPARGGSIEAYKALVCVFLFGGMDNHDTIIPYDTAQYDSWAGIRTSLLRDYGIARARDSLLPLASVAGSFGARQFALPPELSGLHHLFQAGQAAIVGNVGPLLAPTDAASFRAETVRLPSRLFSHNDMQATWMSGAPEGARFGWAGLFADIARRSGANGEGTFAAITTGGADLLITGRETTPYQVVGRGALEHHVLEELDGALRASLESHLRADSYRTGNLLAQDMAARVRAAFIANGRYSRAVKTGGDRGTAFPATELGMQLEAVAAAIAARDALNTRRQIFAVGLGGFDTHSNQAVELPRLQRELDAAIIAFHSAMQEQGLAQDVLTFTASDFGRTLAVNGDGTDHGWGGHHFVVGGGVAGQRIFGTIPPAQLGHDRDAGGGRLIPDVSVEQFAAPLGRWFGLSENALASIFPNLPLLGPRLALMG